MTELTSFEKYFFTYRHDEYFAPSSASCFKKTCYKHVNSSNLFEQNLSNQYVITGFEIEVQTYMSLFKDHRNTLCNKINNSQYHIVIYKL